MSSPISKAAWIDRVFTKLSKLDPTISMNDLQRIAQAAYLPDDMCTPEDWAEIYHSRSKDIDKREWLRAFYKRVLDIEPRLSTMDLWDLADYSWREYPSHRLNAIVAANHALGVEIDRTLRPCLPAAND